MPTIARYAVFEAVLVFFDEPHLITLTAGKTRFVAIAIPDSSKDRNMFFSVSVSTKDWEKYLNGTVDLLYLFKYVGKNYYYFDLNEIKNRKVKMTPNNDLVLPEENLPPPRFFSSNHTEQYASPKKATKKERLLIDGEWELTDFGQFQQRYADIYVFIQIVMQWINSKLGDPKRFAIVNLVKELPYRGGSSYLHLFRELSSLVPSESQINLRGVSYNSPGYIDVTGSDSVFNVINTVLENFISRKRNVSAAYKDFHEYLSEFGYLRMSASDYGFNNPMDDKFLGQSRSLYEAMGFDDFETVLGISDGNALVCSKIVLSLYRRINDTSVFFEQGRIAFNE